MKMSFAADRCGSGLRGKGRALALRVRSSCKSRTEPSSLV